MDEDQKQVEVEVEPMIEEQADPPARDWTRPPTWEPVDKKVRHRMSNRVRKARDAITRLAETGGPQMLGWLQDAANGIPKRDLKGEPLRDANGSIMWLVKPDPLGAFKAMADVMDYHLPRLTRQDVAVAARVEHREFDPATANSEQLQQALLEQFGLLQQQPVEGEIIDVTPEPVPVVPDWLK